jgi:hypothetical protein
MGIGSVALRDQEYTYFSRSWTDLFEAGVLKRTFALDTRMGWSIQGILSGHLTRWIESAISVYMQMPRFQRILMLPVLPLRTLFGIHPVFRTIPCRGKVTFTYQVDGHHVDVRVTWNVPFRPQDTLCLLNELSAAWFTAGWDGKRQVSPPPGWEKVDPTRIPVSLIDPDHGIRFFLDQPSVTPPVPFTLFKGREKTGDLCWAGFCIELGQPDVSPGLTEVRYRIGIVPGAYS